MKNIFGKNIFDENIFGNNIFFGKGFDFPSLLSTPSIQLPTPLTSYLKLGGGRNETNSRTGRSNDCSFYIYRLPDVIVSFPKESLSKHGDNEDVDDEADEERDGGLYEVIHVGLPHLPPVVRVDLARLYQGAED